MPHLSEVTLLCKPAPPHVEGLCREGSKLGYGIASLFMAARHSFSVEGNPVGKLRSDLFSSASVDAAGKAGTALQLLLSKPNTIIERVVTLERLERSGDSDTGRLAYRLFGRGSDLTGPGKDKTVIYDRLDMGAFGPPVADCSILTMLSASIRNRIAAPPGGTALGDGCQFTLVSPPKNFAFERATTSIANRKHRPELLFDLPALDLYFALTSGKGKHAAPTTTTMGRFRDAGRYELVAAIALTATDDLVITHRDPSDPTCGLVVRTKDTTERKSIVGALKANLGHYILYAHYALIPPDSYPAAPLTSSSARAPAPLAGAPSLSSAPGAAGRGGSF